MTNLTEQLHQGKLPDNHHYYYKMPNGKYETGNTFCVEWLHWCKDGDKIEVLEEVPDYDRWQAVLKYNKAAKGIIDTQAKENTKLKKLLKRVLEVLEMVQGETIDFAKSVDECIDKINQVLQKKE